MIIQIVAIICVLQYIEVDSKFVNVNGQQVAHDFHHDGALDNSNSSLNAFDLGPDVDLDFKLRVKAPGKKVKAGVDILIDVAMVTGQYPGLVTPNPSDCSKVCQLDYDPVCGSDGVIYTNECYLTVMNCRFNSTVQVVNQEVCNDEIDELLNMNVTMWDVSTNGLSAESSFNKYEPRSKKWGGCPLVTPPVDGGIETCNTDQSCLPFMRCCRTVNGKECIFTEESPRTSIDCGCSIAVYFEKSDFTAFSMSVIRRFLWLAFRFFFNESTEISIMLSNILVSYLPSDIDNHEDLYMYIQTLTNSVIRNPKYFYDPFSTKARKLLMILELDDENAEVTLKTLKHMKNIVEKVCVILVGNNSRISNEMVEELSTGCFYQIETYVNLADKMAELGVDLQISDCGCAATTAFVPLIEIGGSCSNDDECYDKNCDSGTCSAPDCPAPSSIRYFFSQFSKDESLEYLRSIDPTSEKNIIRKLEKQSQYNSDNVWDYWPLSPSLIWKNAGQNGCCNDKLFQCPASKICLYGELLCNGIDDCLQGEDEDSIMCANRVCGTGYFRCNTGQCIFEEKKCDGISDCNDGSDETCQQSDCPLERPYYCVSGECINPFQECDGIVNCASREDEAHCTCYGYKCKSGECIPQSFMCDGSKDCKDGDDEDDRCLIGCPSDSEGFTCNSGLCISESYICDGEDDCGDGSDENSTMCSTLPCRGFQCNSGECISSASVCNFHKDCPDSSDEFCKNTDSYDICDGVVDKPDGSDEVGCTAESCPNDRSHYCPSNECIEKNKVCNGVNDCSDGSDESGCPISTCPSNQFSCSYGECLSESREFVLCDGINDCLDGSDENDCQAQNCTTTNRNFQCDDGICIESAKVCDSFPHCPDGSDENESFCSSYTCPNANDHQCTSGQCINDFIYGECNGRRDCVDGSDETNCVNCMNGSLPCGNGQCYPEELKCDGKSDCSNSEDEANCTVICEDGYFQCETGNECIDQYSRCDGYPDCRDGSDEHMCENSDCMIDQFKCSDGKTCILSYAVCDDWPDCLDGSDELNCYIGTCADNEFTCNNGKCISSDKRCDGKQDCSMAEDEDCSGLSCSNSTQLQCPSGDCLPNEFRCDKYFDCSNAADEQNCIST